MPPRINIICATMYAIYCAQCHEHVESLDGSVRAHENYIVLKTHYEHLCKARGTRHILCQKCTADINPIKE